jgi:N-acetyl-anhydromuramyl-L-alanine amidase AmpD
LIPELGYSNIFFDEWINKTSIIVCLENLGWVEKKQLTNYHINWNGNIYNESPYEKKWRDFFFWQPYTEEQMGSLVLLCEKLCLEFSIPRKSVGHNTKFEGIKNFDGIVSRSNYDSRFTDLNPSFDFELFKKEIEYE